MKINEFRKPRKIKKVWNQTSIPVIYRRGTGHPLLMRLPYKEGNRSWLKHYGRINPQWIVTKNIGNYHRLGLMTLSADHTQGLGSFTSYIPIAPTST